MKKLIGVLVCIALFIVASFVLRGSARQHVAANVLIEQTGRYRLSSGPHVADVWEVAEGALKFAVYREQREGRDGGGPAKSFQGESDWFLCWDSQGRLWSYVPEQDLQGCRCWYSDDASSGSRYVGTGGGWEGIPESFFARLPDEVKETYKIYLKEQRSTNSERNADDLAISEERQPSGYHGESLSIDHRYGRSIRFEPIGINIPITKDNAFLRVDDGVEDMDQHQADLFEELEIEPVKIVFTNPAAHGRQTFLKFADGKSCSFIWVQNSSDDRITRIRIEHEKFHALMRLMPEGVDILSARLKDRGFDIDLSDYDEELAATIVEILSLHLMGVPFEEISGSEFPTKAREILMKNQRQISQISRSDAIKTADKKEQEIP